MFSYLGSSLCLAAKMHYGTKRRTPVHMGYGSHSTLWLN